MLVYCEVLWHNNLSYHLWHTWNFVSCSALFITSFVMLSVSSFSIHCTLYHYVSLMHCSSAAEHSYNLDDDRVQNIVVFDKRSMRSLKGSSKRAFFMCKKTFICFCSCALTHEILEESVFEKEMAFRLSNPK